MFRKDVHIQTAGKKVCTKSRRDLSPEVALYFHKYLIYYNSMSSFFGLPNAKQERESLQDVFS